MIPKQRRPVDDDPERVARTRTLAIAAAAGDRDAFGELYRLYHGTVYAFAWHRTSNAALAHDITHDAFTRALAKIDTFTEWNGSGFIGWVTTIARNLLADHFKASRNRFEIPVAEWFEADVITPAVDEEVLAGLTAAEVHAAIARLSDSQRQCITLRFLKGLSVIETADAMGKHEGAIKTLQYRATLTLGRLLLHDPRQILEAAA